MPDDTPVRSDRARRRDRRRHDGRRHRDELPQRRHSGHAARDEARRRSTRGVGDHPQELRERGEEGQAHAGQGRRSAWRCSTPTLTYDDLRDADLVIEAVFEDMDVKQQVFATLDDVAKPGAILATNTSTLDVDQIAAGTQPPAGRDRHALLQPGQRDEAAGGRARRADRRRTCSRRSCSSRKRIGKTAVVSGVCDGFIGNRMLEQYLRQALFLLEEGASPAAGRSRAREVRHGDGPVPHERSRRQRRRLARSASAATSRSPHVAYSRDRRPAVRASAASARRPAPAGIATKPGRRDAIPRPRGRRRSSRRTATRSASTPRKIGDEEIVERCIYALVNEGAHILEEGIALRASDIDMVYLDRLRLSALSRRADVLRRHAGPVQRGAPRCSAFATTPGADAAFWKPAPLLARLAAEGKTFNG